MKGKYYVSIYNAKKLESTYSVNFLTKCQWPTFRGYFWPKDNFLFYSLSVRRVS